MTQANPEMMTRAQAEAEYSTLLATFRVATKILAVRFFLFLSLIGSFILSIIATYNQSAQSAYVLFLYAGVTTFPLAILEWLARKGRSGE